MSSQWYVMHSKPNKEELLWEQLTARQIESFYPRIRVQTVNPRARQVRPYFPGYVFVHLNLEQTGLSSLKWMPGATGFVSYDHQPAMVADGFISILKKRMDELNLSGGEIFKGLQPGDLVEIRNGPFAGYEAIFDGRLPGNERVRILLKMLQGRSTKMEISSGQLEVKRKRT